MKNKIKNMTSYAKSCFPIALQSVKDAISKDGRGDTKVFKNIFVYFSLFFFFFKFKLVIHLNCELRYLHVN